MCDKNATTDKYISREKIRADFYRCRDFELANLWQRSIFLSAFLILGFTGYGYIVLKIIEISCSGLNHQSLPYLHLVAIGISVLNILFSILWIMMGKGSKAWYEVYENAICIIDQETIEYNYDDNNYRMGKLCHTYGFDKSLSSGKAGPFSVSKINIGIGQICFWLWIAIIVLHSILNIEYWWIPNSGSAIFIAITNIILIVAVIILYYFFKNKWFQSGYLKKAHKD